MRFPYADSFRLQVAVSVLASLSMLALAFVLVREVLLSTEQALAHNAEQQCITAVEELRQQFTEQEAVRAQSIGELPIAAQDVSLRGLSMAVLNSYDGLSGGFWLPEAGRYAGGSDPARQGGLPEIELTESAVLDRLVRRAAVSRVLQTASELRGEDIVVAAAIRTDDGRMVAWTLRRLVGVRDPVLAQRRWWVAGLILSALIGLGGIISISVRLRRGVQFIEGGLRRLESDFGHRLPVIGGDFGEISAAINQMAERRAALERTLRQQDRLAALGKVVAGVAHEIRNPLNSMRLTLELLDRRNRNGTVTGEEVSGAVEEIDRLDRILSRLLAFGRSGAEERCVQDVVPLLRRAANLAKEPAERKKVTLDLEAGDGSPLLADVDGLQIEQVILNLLLNAIDASPPGEPVILSAEQEDRWIVVRVADKGEGIDESIREHIFDPYFTTKETGSGLGLAISRDVAMNHGGSLDFSTGDDGTEFILRVPAGRSDE